MIHPRLRNAGVKGASSSPAIFAIFTGQSGGGGSKNTDVPAAAASPQTGGFDMSDLVSLLSVPTDFSPATVDSTSPTSFLYKQALDLAEVMVSQLGSNLVLME